MRLPSCFLAAFFLCGAALGIDAPWKHVGPFAAGGSVNALTVSPSSADTAYAATDAGVFKTVDGGKHWDRASRGLPLLPTMALAADPSAASRLYTWSLGNGMFRTSDGGSSWESAGAGLPPNNAFASLAIDSAGVLYVSIFGEGVYKSADYGDTWTGSSQGLGSPYGSSLTVAPGEPSILYAVTDTGIFRTTNGGAQWIRVSTMQFGMLVVDPKNASVVYGVSDLGVSKSVDGGSSWMAKNAGLRPGTAAGALTVDPASDTTLYLLAGSAVYKSTDGGENWGRASRGIQTVDFCPKSILIAPSAPDTLYLSSQCAGGVFRSDDAAASWARTADAFAPPAIAALVPNPGSSAVFAATDRGVFLIDRGGAYWTALNAGLTDLNVVSLAQAPSDAATLYAGTGSGQLYRSEDRGLTWLQTSFGAQVNPGPLAVDPVSASTVYVGAYDRLLKSEDGGRGWTTVGEFGDGISTLIFQGSTLYLGTYGGAI